MEHLTEQLQQALKSNEKNISDLVNQEMTLCLLAYFFKENPILLQAKNQVFQEIFKKTSYHLSQLCLRWIEQTVENEISTEEWAKINQEIQFIVHQIVQEKQDEADEWLYFWKKVGI